MIHYHENSHEAIVLTLEAEAVEGGSRLLKLPQREATNVSSRARLTAALKAKKNDIENKFY